MSQSLVRFAVAFALAGALAGCGGGESAPEVEAGLPEDVTGFVARAAECLSWSDEARANGPNADASRDQVMAAWTENRCETLGADGDALRTTHAGDAAAIAAVDTALTPVDTGEAATSTAAPAAATPATGEAGLAAFIQKAETCAFIAGETGDDAERNAELQTRWNATGCEFLEAETRATRAAYAGNAEVLARVEAAVTPLGL